MGHNIDLENLLGLPKYIRCPYCKEMTRSNFNDYDIDCGSPEAANGIMTLSIQCDHCEEDIDFEIEIKFKK